MSVELNMIRKYLPAISSDLQQVFAHDGVVEDLESGTEILQEGQSVKMIPLVLEGLIKVFTRNEDRELLLYYIEPRESCVMSFLAGIKNKPSKFLPLPKSPRKSFCFPHIKLNCGHVNTRL